MRLSAKVAAIEFGERDVRLAVVKTGGKLPRVLEAHASPVAYSPQDDAPKHADTSAKFDAFVDAVQNVVSRVKARPTVCVLCASSKYGVVRAITVPFRGRRRVAAAVPYELEPFLAFPIEELVVDFNTIREVDGQTEVLAVGMRRAPLEEQLAILAAAGLEVEGINIDAVGLTALWQGGRRSRAGMEAVLHVRDNGSVLAVVNNKALAYFRHLSLTAALFHENPRGAAREVQNSLRAFLAGWEGDTEIRALTVTGLDFFEEERELFEEGFRVPVQYVDLLADVKGADLTREAISPEEPPEAGAIDADRSPAGQLPRPENNNAFEAVIGVALSAAGGVCSFDFRKGPLASATAHRGMVAHTVFSSCLALLLLAGYAVHGYVDYRNNVAETERIGARIWEIFAECFPDSQFVKQGRRPHDIGGAKTFESMAREVEEMGTGARALPVELFGAPTLLDILAEISEKMPEGKVSITALTIEGGRKGTLTISGEINDPNSFNEIYENLKKAESFEVVGEPERSVAAGETTFKVTARR